MDGASEELERVLRLCEKYKLTAVLDIHAVRGSQNGLDNSGNTDSYEWIPLADSKGGVARYHHWDIRGADWVGHYNTTTFRYDSINASHIDFTLDVVRELIERHKHDPVVIGIEPLNEPWWVIPLDVLKQFYWKSYQIVQKEQPKWITLFHDSFRLWPQEWGDGWMQNCPNFAIDTHIYQAWDYPGDVEHFQQAACANLWQIQLLEQMDLPIVVGEWSLATDNCAMWLNGFNDNVPGYPKVECERVSCPEPYMGKDQPGAPPDQLLGAQDPFGMGGESYVEYGTCPKDKLFPNEVDAVRDLSYAKLNVFDRHTHGQFFWNFRTEFEPRWDYMRAVDLGWIPKSWDRDSPSQKLIEDACPFRKKEPRTLEPAVAPTESPAFAMIPASPLVAASISSVISDVSNAFLSLSIVSLSANVWTATLAFFAIGWVLICCRRPRRRGYIRVPEAPRVLPRRDTDTEMGKYNGTSVQLSTVSSADSFGLAIGGITSVVSGATGDASGSVAGGRRRPIKAAPKSLSPSKQSDDPQAIVTQTFDDV